MLKNILLSSVLILLSTGSSFAKNTTHQQAAYQQAMGFTKNAGQLKDQYGNPRKDIQFILHGKGMNIFVGSGELHYQFLGDEKEGKVQAYRLDMHLTGANKNAELVTTDKQPGFNTYHLPGLYHDVTACTYNKVTYRNVYPGIDWVLYVRNDVLEYEFHLQPGADPRNIKLEYTGGLNMTQDKSGNICITTPMGTIMEHAPYTYAQNGDKLNSAFSLRGTQLSFKVAKHAGGMVIDPVLTWATYYGGSDADYSQGVKVDAAGNIYMCGYTSSTGNIATVGSQQSSLAAGSDGFIVKFNSAGVRQWATYYGGSSDDLLYAVSCDTSGNVYAAGRTMSSSGIASLTAHQTTMFGLSDAFLVKLNNAGQLLWCTYYGGYSNEYGYAVDCDKQNNVYLCGATSSGNNIATTGTHQAFQFGGYQAFLVKFNSAGVRQWGTYFGGTSDDYGYAVCVDGASNIYIAGRATSSDYISSTGAFQTAFAGGANDGFLAKFNSLDGNTYWSTYYGDAGDDQLLGVACHDNLVYICGQTDGTTSIATALANQSTFGGGVADGFLVQFDSAGARQWATYYGGGSDDYATAVSCDASGNAYLAGYTNSSNNIASATTYQASPGGGLDAFLAKFTSSGTRSWGTYYGGSGDDRANGVSCLLDNIYLCGYTGSTSAIATNAAHQTSLGSDPDGFLAKFGDCANAPAQPGNITGLSPVCDSTSQNYFVLPVPGATSYTWTLPAGWSGSSTGNSIYTTTGATSGVITVTANNGCGSSTVQTFNVTVSIPHPAITQANNLLSVSTFSSYQWYHDGQLIPGATNQDYTATQDGDYYVHVTDAGGCSGNSDTITVTVVGVQNVRGSGPSLAISPNPATNMFAISGQLPQAVVLHLTLTDLAGRILLEENYQCAEGDFSKTVVIPGDIAKGLYLLKIVYGDTSFMSRLLKD